MIQDAKKRLEALRELLTSAELSTQEELRTKLEKQDFDVTQSTISRDLRKLGAIRTVDTQGNTVYRLPDEVEPPVAPTSLNDLITEITTNGSLIVIHTPVGCAPLVARHLDNVGSDKILGTIAGDDTVFVAPAKTTAKDIKETIRAIENCLSPE